jgi:hypothetical protein
VSGAAQGVGVVNPKFVNVERRTSNVERRSQGRGWVWTRKLAVVAGGCSMLIVGRWALDVGCSTFGTGYEEWVLERRRAGGRRSDAVAEGVLE